MIKITFIQSSRTLTMAALSALFLCPVFGQAKEYTTKGTGSYVQISSEPTQLANGTVAVHTISKGILVCDDENDPIHLATQDVAGTMVYDEDGNLIKGMGYADGITRDGDVFTITWVTNEKGNDWKYIDGTGIFEGVKGGGTTENLVIHPDMQQVIRFEGTVILKD